MIAHLPIIFENDPISLSCTVQENRFILDYFFKKEPKIYLSEQISFIHFVSCDIGYFFNHKKMIPSKTYHLSIALSRTFFDSFDEIMLSVKWDSTFSTYSFMSFLAWFDTCCMLDISCCNILLCCRFHSWMFIDAFDTYWIYQKVKPQGFIQVFRYANDIKEHWPNHLRLLGCQICNNGCNVWQSLFLLFLCLLLSSTNSSRL